MKLDVFIRRCREKHDDKFDYSHNEKEILLKDKIKIICPIHGEFTQNAQSHMDGTGCPSCSGRRKGSTESFIAEARKIHGDKYDYSKVDYVNRKTKVTIICPKHGEFQQTPTGHLNNGGCEKCGIERRGQKNIHDIDDIKKQINEKKGDKYNYDWETYCGIKKKMRIICPIHGEFWQTVKEHIEGSGCPKCSKISSAKYFRKSFDDFVSSSIIVHDGKYTYPQDNSYTKSFSKADIICPIHGHFQQWAYQHLNGCGCPKCSHAISNWEIEVKKYIASLGFDIEGNVRRLLQGQQEIDIYIPSLHIGIECDGLKYHSEEFRTNTSYHLNKTLTASVNGIRLLHIFEDEWKYKKDIVKSMLANIVGQSPNRIYARKCSIREVSYSDKKTFLNENHIQGDVASKYNIGLYHQDELVALMTFGSLRRNVGSTQSNDREYELLRFCNKLNTNVIGGASKLFKHFIRTYNPKKIKTFCDLRYYVGVMYEKLGFTYDHMSQPNYYYVVNDMRENRFKYRKDVLVKEGYDPNLSEHEIMLSRGIYRIYDCGTKVYYWTNGQTS